MIDLAHITVTTLDGADILLPMSDVLRVGERGTGATIHVRNSQTAYSVTQSVTSVKSLIDTKWSEWLNALAGLPGSSISGTYTPTLTNVTNVAASTAYECQYMRVGSTVSVSGKVDVDPTAATTVTQLGISLPIASNFGVAEDCAGVASSSDIISESAAILADATNNRAEMNWITTSLANHTMYFSFEYQVI